jgi:hypothetical protein
MDTHIYTLSNFGSLAVHHRKMLRACCDSHGHGKTSYAPHESTIALHVLEVIVSMSGQVKSCIIREIPSTIGCIAFHTFVSLPQYGNQWGILPTLFVQWRSFLLFIHCLLLRWACKVIAAFVLWSIYVNLISINLIYNLALLLSILQPSCNLSLSLSKGFFLALSRWG